MFFKNRQVCMILNAVTETKKERVRAVFKLYDFEWFLEPDILFRLVAENLVAMIQHLGIVLYDAIVMIFQVQVSTCR